MTQDYKDTLLRYLTGNLNIETGSNEPQFSETKSKSSDINDYINDNVIGSWNAIDIIQGYQSIYSVIYGNTSTNGFLVILDEDMNPIQFIDSYASGTKFGLFQILRVDEEGKFFGIDINNGTPRFIMLNNIVLKLPAVSEFSVNLRRSYSLPSPLSTASKYFEIIKSVGQARYLIGATIMQSGDPYQLATELVINVGAENEWNDYYDQTSTFEGQCMWASWNEDVLSFKIGGYVAGSAPFYVEYQRWNGTIGKWSMEIPTPSGYEQGNYSINTVILNSSTAYVSIFSSGEYGQEENMNIYKIDYADEDVDLVETISGINLITKSPENRVKFKIKNGIVFFLYKQYEKYSGVNNTYVYAGIILGMNAYYSYGLSEDGDIDNYYLCIANLFNLYNYYIIGLDSEAGARGGDDFFIQQLYNPNNYNGIAYENINSLCPNSAVLYDNSNNIAFARNLYNVSHYGNTTLSVVQIPNTQVNDITLTPKLLIGETNKILVNDEESFVKNIYETVYLNFYNQISIENRNQVPYIQNELASNILNASTSYAFDYSATKATKIRVNYLDNTNKVFNINPSITIGEETTITGNNQLTLQNAKQENVISYTVDGATEQDGTPTPDNPQEIKTIRNVVKVKITNEDESEEKEVLIDLAKENLFDKNNVNSLNGYIINTSNTIISHSTSNMIYVPIETNKTYTVSKIVNNRFAIATTETEPAIGTTIKNIQQNYTAPSLTIKTDSTDKYLVVFTWNQNASSPITLEETLNSISIYEGTNSTPYHELCKIGDYKDTLSINDSGQVVINKNIGKVILNGSETIYATTSTSDWYRYNITNIGAYKNSDSANKVMVKSNYLNGVPFNDRTTTNAIFNGANGTDAIYFNIDVSNNITTVAQLKTWLSTHNTDVYYVLATPETITLSNTTLPLFDGINHITLVEDLETNTSITYDTVSKATYNIQIAVPYDNLITNLQIISEDETTTYQTISLLSLESGKIYNITQDCYVE